MRGRKLFGSRQRFLSSRFILPRRERPLLAGKRVSMHCERNEAVEMRGCPGAIAFEYTHERNILIGEKITGPIIMPKTSLQIYSLRA